MNNVSMMREIKEYDPNGGDDGGVLHPPVECVMSKCAHGFNAHRCRTLGECGCAHAYARACEPGGYLVIRRDNPIREALLDKGMVTEQNAGSYFSNHGELRVVRLTARK